MMALPSPRMMPLTRTTLAVLPATADRRAASVVTVTAGRQGRKRAIGSAGWWKAARASLHWAHLVRFRRRSCHWHRERIRSAPRSRQGATTGRTRSSRRSQRGRRLRGKHRGVSRRSTLGTRTRRTTSLTRDELSRGSSRGGLAEGEGQRSEGDREEHAVCVFAWVCAVRCVGERECAWVG